MLSEDSEDFSTRTKLSLNDVKTLIDLCLNKCYFVWDNQIRTLDDAGPIGLSLMVVISEAFLQKIERVSINSALQKPIPVAPKSYRRYVDDTHARFENRDKANEFLHILNEQDERVQFSIEYEDENKSINFLDTTIINNKQGSYDFKVYRKDAITNVQIKPTSSIEPKTVAGVFKGFLVRAKRICSPQYLDDERVFLKNVFIENGYSKDYLNNIIKNHMTNRTVPPENNIDYKSTVTFPWIPGISTK